MKEEKEGRKRENWEEVKFLIYKRKWILGSTRSIHFFSFVKNGTNNGLSNVIVILSEKEERKRRKERKKREIAGERKEHSN